MVGKVGIVMVVGERGMVMTGEKPRSVDQDESGRVKKCRTHLLTSGASFPPRLLILWMEIVEIE